MGGKLAISKWNGSHRIERELEREADMHSAPSLTRNNYRCHRRRHGGHGPICSGWKEGREAIKKRFPMPDSASLRKGERVCVCQKAARIRLAAYSKGVERECSYF